MLEFCSWLHETFKTAGTNTLKVINSYEALLGDLAHPGRPLPFFEAAVPARFLDVALKALHGKGFRAPPSGWTEAAAGLLAGLRGHGAVPQLSEVETIIAPKTTGNQHRTKDSLYSYPARVKSRIAAALKDDDEDDIMQPVPGSDAPGSPFQVAASQKWERYCTLHGLCTFRKIYSKCFMNQGLTDAK